jgi:hypothetical protein
VEAVPVAPPDHAAAAVINTPQAGSNIFNVVKFLTIDYMTAVIK